MPLIHCSSTLYYHRATVPLFYLTLLLLRHCSTVPPHFTATAPLLHCSPTLYYRCATAPVFLHTLLSLRHCSTVPPHFTFTVPLFHCSFTLNYHCFTAPLFQHSLLQLWSPCAMTICSNYTRTHRCNKTCLQWTAMLSGSVLRSLVCTWQFWRREWDLKGYFTAEKWKTFLNKNHTTSQEAKKSDVAPNQFQTWEKIRSFQWELTSRCMQNS